MSDADATDQDEDQDESKTEAAPAPEDLEINSGPTWEEVEKSPEKYAYGEDGQDYVDRDVIDFDPKDNLYVGTAVDGTSDIPDPSAGTPDSGSTDAGSTDAAESTAGGGGHRPKPGPGEASS